MVFDSACLALQGFGSELHRHEDLLGHVVFGVDTESGGGRKAESRVEVGVAQDDQRRGAYLSAALEPRTNQC